MAVTRGRATRGSRRQVQDYVNLRDGALNAAVLVALPPALAASGAAIRWTSPLAADEYEEYRDAAFLSAIGLPGCAGQLRDFWPAMGPSWDALGLAPAPILVEAKSHIPEIYGSGCQASAHSLSQIERALGETKAWLGADPAANWLGPLYQYGNRLAHLYFLREKVGTPAWLVNLYFVDDPIGPTTEAEWRAAIAEVKTTLGLSGPVPGSVDVFLPVIEI